MAYDEFSMLHENAAEFDLPFDGAPTVRRVAVALPDGRNLSALVWGDGPPELVLVHGGAQNAHTWDTVCLALGRSLVAVDMPGHGQSDWREDHSYSVASSADDLAFAMAELVRTPIPVIGMSLGGLTSIALTARYPEIVSRLMLVDVTPGVDKDKAEPIAAFVAGPEQFASFDEILERTVAYNPTRSESSLRRGILHNAVENPDGTWRWRYDRIRLEGVTESGQVPSYVGLWDAIGEIAVPLWLVRGSLSGVVVDADADELQRRVPSARVEVVEGAGHSIQGDRPIELVALINEFLET